MKDYTQKRYRKQRFFNKLRSGIWSLFCLLAAIAVGLVLLAWAMPWLKSLFTTITN